jgi:hypothetical protein
MRTVHISTELPTDASRVWAAVCHPASFLYVCRGLIGFPALVGRTEPLREGETGTSWMMLFHAIPLSRHTIHIVDIDDQSRSIRTREYGGFLRTWNHTLHVEPVAAERCRYSDTVDTDAGVLTAAVVKAAVVIYAYRQRRWRKLVARHLLPTGPAYAR